MQPEHDEWRFYHLEVGPDRFGRALLVGQWGASAPNAVVGSTRTPIPAPPRTRWLGSPAAGAAAATAAKGRDQAVRPPGDQGDAPAPSAPKGHEHRGDGECRTSSPLGRGTG